MPKEFRIKNCCYFILVHLCVYFSYASSLEGCLMPTEIQDGEIIYESPDDISLETAPLNYVLQFKCNPGFEKLGFPVIICGPQNKWTGEAPLCVELQCQEPPEIANGAYEISIGTNINPILESVAQYSCNRGFEMVNESATTLKCTLKNNRAVWEGQVSSCKETNRCTDPGTPSNGQRRGNCCLVGDSLQYKCDSGFELIGERQISCEHGGFWSGLHPTCRPLSGSCPNPPTIPHGHIKRHKRGDYYVSYDEIEVMCDTGYAHFGESRFIMCEEDFTWEFDFGECKEVFCDRPNDVANGTIVYDEVTNKTKFPHETIISYVCDAGFRLVGSSRRQCDYRGKWTENEPHCEPMMCYDPGVPENGMRNGNDFHVGAKVIFSCFSGFSIIGSVERYCLPNGQWNGQLTRCDLTSYYCPDPGVPVNGIKIGKSYNQGDTVEFRCQPEFSLIGSSVRECLPNSVWSGEEAKCLGDKDFDNIVQMKEFLKETINEKAKEQEKSLKKRHQSIALFELSLQTGQRFIGSVQRKRILQITSSERFILYFLFDVSGSVGRHNFKVSIRFAKALVKKIGISEDGARAGAMTFSSKAVIRFYPVQFNTTDAVLEQLDMIEYSKGGTATNSALHSLTEDMIPLTKSLLGAKGMKSVVFILTDGKANTGGSPEEKAKELKEAGVEIYCIGITGDIRKNGLYSIASKPKNHKEKFVFILENYKSLEWVIEELMSGTVDYSKCGLGLENVGEMKPQPRIAGGNTVQEPWPWMAAINIKDAGKLSLKCGGSIIGERYVLTAAHCVCMDNNEIPIPLSDIIVRLGLTDIENSTYLQEFEVDNIIVHDNYNGTFYDYDAAVLILSRPIQYDPYVRPICLPPRDIPEQSSLYKPTERAFAAGWGYEKVSNGDRLIDVKSTNVLKEVYLPLQTRELCMESFVNFNGIPEQFTERMFCAGTGDATGDTCSGDSGGPLMQSQFNTLNNLYWIQTGIVSWGINTVRSSCGLDNAYGYYTNVHKILPWINNVLFKHRHQDSDDV